ncbi:high-affinity nickel-transport family protein [Klebsormidium nitens]|uniref:High-affinity nickel-transport family protein n=1 Tax=Klebsormidium nitens TaxID=105231 RepID=A0A1Y1HVS6_KLENI|nr:high-affinity nickel-transport family protein [Klebsormidium nitens]|eukprot:GAQ81299.1 high-affinity nickel-transport family protein [Klebsormidium nitens]
MQKSCLRGQAVIDTKCRAASQQLLWPVGTSGERQLRVASSEHAFLGKRVGAGASESRRGVRPCGFKRPLVEKKAPVARLGTPSRGSDKNRITCTSQFTAVTDNDHVVCPEVQTDAATLQSSSADLSPRNQAFALLLAKLPKLLCIAALCSVLLLPSRPAWAANGATATLARPARFARFSIVASLVSIKEAFRVASAGELLASAWTGLVAGCLHTLTGPDHLAALAPMSIGRTRLQSAWMGALWGCGHDAGQLLFGLLFLLLKERLHMDLLSQWSGVVIGVTLCGIGALGLYESRQLSASIHEPPPEERPLTPAYAGASTSGASEEYRPEETATDAPRGTASSSKPFGVATFITGIFHGFQPDALIMILPALALPSKLAGLSFLVTFLLGTILAMGSYTAFIGASCEVLGEQVPGINEKLSQVSSMISIFVGAALISSNAFGFKIL